MARNRKSESAAARPPAESSPLGELSPHSQALDLAPVMIRGVEGKITFWSRGLERLYGFSGREAIGQISHQLLHTEFPRPLAQIQEEFLDRGEWAGELEHRRRNGKAVVVASQWSLWRDEGRSGPAAVTEVNNDITEIKRAQDTNAYLASIVASSEDAILSKSLEGIVTSWNRSAELLFGYRAEEICGRPVTVLFPPDRLGEEQEILARIGAGEKIDHYETVRLKKNGEQVVVSLSISPICDRTGAIVGASKILRDISAQKLALARAEELQSELLHISRLSTMGQMATGLAHELNQPLTAISGYLSGIRRLIATGSEPARVDEAVAKAIEQTARAGDIVRRLRDFVIKGETRQQVHDINETLEETLKLALVGAKPLGIPAEIDLAANLDPVFMDRIQIGQVILNLVRNALEAMQDMQERRLSVTTRALDEGRAVEIAIADTGHGIAPEIAARLFQPFVTTKASGMGIGLSICREIIEAHEGSISASANEAGGTTFRIVLPTLSVSEEIGEE